MAVIFLSASIPDPKRDAKYHTTADKTAIRDAIRALVTVALPSCKLVWGGHPAITPLVKVIAEGVGVREAEKVVVYQSNFFKKFYPNENTYFEKIVRTKIVDRDIGKSLALMRKRMIESEKFDAGVFIGGMEGVEEEYDLFKKAHGAAKRLPIASTGAAAMIIYQKERASLSGALLDDMAYPSLFRTMLEIPTT